MSYIVMIHTVLIMGSMLGIGALLTRKVRFNTDTFTTLIIFIAVPSLVLVSFLQTPYEQGLYIELLWVFLFSIGIYIVIICLTRWIMLLIGASKQRANELAIVAVHGNTGYIGLPLCAALLGAKGAIFAAMFDMGVGVSMWTVSVMVLQNRVSFSPKALKPLLNVPLVAIILGIILFVSELKIPDYLLQLLQ